MQTSLLEDSLANPGVSQENSEEIQMTVISGTKWLGLLKTYDLDGSLGKMCEALLTCQWASKEVSLTWRVSDTKPHHLLFQLAPQMPNTDENDVGLWATPNTMDHLPQRSEEATIRMMNGHRKGSQQTFQFREQVDENTMKMWPTPTTMDSKEDSLKHATKLIQGKTHRASGQPIQKTLSDKVMMEEIKANPKLMEQYKDYEMVTRKNFTKSTRVRGIHETTDNNREAVQKDKDKEDNNRTLVQERQGGVQSPKHRGLGKDKTSP